jgi:hypothetical protein
MATPGGQRLVRQQARRFAGDSERDDHPHRLDTVLLGDGCELLSEPANRWALVRRGSWRSSVRMRSMLTP